MATLVCKGITDEFLTKLEEHGIQLINKKKVQLNQEQLEIVGDDFDQCCTVATAVGNLEDVKEILDEYGAYSSSSDWTYIRDAAAFFPGKRTPLERSVLVVFTHEDKWNQDKLIQILKVKGFMILKKLERSCNAELAERFGFGSGDSTKNISIYLVESKGAVNALKLCLGPVSEPVKGTIRAKFTGCEFYSSNTDEWRTDARLTNITLENERTLMTVLPHVLKSGKTACLFDEIQDLGFQVIARKRTRLTTEAVRFIYGEQSSEDFLAALTEGNLEAAVFEKVGAIEALQMCLGPSNKNKKTYKNTIRAKYGLDPVRCACLSSEDAEAASKEITYFFPNVAAESDAEDFLKAKGISKSLQEVLMKGLKELSAAKPENPVQSFGKWLLMQSKTDKKVKQKKSASSSSSSSSSSS